MRVGTLNVGTMTGRGRELADLMERRKVGVLCVQETRWKGDKAKELGGGCKLLRSGANKQGRNGVGIVISKDLKEDLISVSKRSDRVMSIKLGVEETVVNIICAYAPQVGCTEEEKETFWEQMDQELSATLDDERVIVGGYLNGHIGRSRDGIERIHGGWGMRDRNDEGEKIVDTAMAFDLAIVNTFFEKKVNQFVTYNSGGRESQIDFLMCRRCHLKEVINCKVINGEAVAAQHRVLVMDWDIQRGKKRKPELATPRIKWWRLREDNLKVQFREKVLDKVRPVESVQEWWEETSTTILIVGQDVLGMTTGRRPPGDNDGVPNKGVTQGISRNEVKVAISRMKNGKATGMDGIPVEVWKCLGEEGIDMLWDLMKGIYEQEKIPTEWRDSVIIPIYKEKGDIQDCGNYRGIKLMSHTMKIWERIIDRRLREETTIGDEQFGFMPGRGTTDAIFAVRQLMEKHREKQKELHMVFIDLEKAYDRVPRQEVWRCMREKGVPEKYVTIVQNMYEGARTRVKSNVGLTDMIPVGVGLHQGSSLSPYLFAMIMDVLARGIKDISPWCMLYADDIVLCGTRSDVVEKKLEEWRRAMEDRGLKINRKKTVYLRFNVDRDLDDGNSDVNIQGKNLERVNTFKYLGATLAENGDLDAEMTHRIQSGWKNWKRISGILCDRRISLRVKGKVYKTVVRPAMMYGAETWAVKKAHEKKLDVAEMRMLRWMSGVTKMDRIRNERIRGTTKVGEISKKVQESRLKWYGHVSRREDEYVGKRVLGMEVPGKRRRGRPKRRWMDNIRNDLSERGLSEEDAQDRFRWRRLTRHIDPT